jgi:acyl-CoA dehydrogenase
MDFGPDTEQRAVIDTVRRFVQTELVPHEDLVERTDEVPAALAAHIRARALSAGLYAANMPADLGGGGLDPVCLTLVERELGWTSYALQALVARPSNILQACTGDQVDRYLLPAIRGERHDCLAMTEPEAGSDLRAMTTTARRDGNGWRISGTKHFISHADTADFVVLFARSEAAAGAGTAVAGRAGKARDISAFLVDLDSPGLVMRRGSPSVSHRGYHHCELVFTDVAVSEQQLLGEVGAGFALLTRWLGASRLSVAAFSVGRGRRVLGEAVRWAANRRQFGRAIGSFQGVAFPLADSATELEAAELLTLRAAQRLAVGAMSDADAAMAKLFASEMLGRLTDRAVQVFGGMGLMSELPIERFWRDARVERIWDGTSEVQRHIIAGELLRSGDR